MARELVRYLLRDVVAVCSHAASDQGDVALVEKLITAGQQMGNVTFKTGQRQSTMTLGETPVK